ncbi:MAG: tetratricopeptide repeat protein [Bacteroides sp.]|nr:tetratricopeptide repeat protein [Bacteroides sp.]
MRHILTSSIILSAAILMTGCSSGQKTFTSSPSPITVEATRKSTVDIDVDFNIPANYISSRSRLFITPAYMLNDEIVKEYDPIVLDGPIYTKKLIRNAVLHGKIDPYSLTAIHVLNTHKPHSVKFSETLPIPAGIKEGRIVAVASSDGCGQCTGIDTILVAMIEFPRFELPKARKSYMNPEFKVVPKIHQGNGEARLQFIVDKWDIVPSLANNKAELEKVLATLNPILSDSLATVNSLNIFGSASAEASYQHNVKLATNRANSAKNWLIQNLNIPASVGKIIKVGARPEGWEPVVQAMIAANDPDSIKVRELMIKYPGPTDDAAEKYIRRLPCWKRIQSNYLAKDRKVIYDYTWTIKNFTNDEEMIQIYKTRPDALSEDEFLHVATLAKDDDDRLMVYQDLLKFFPESITAINNMAAIYLEKEQPAKAVELLKDLNSDSPEVLNNLAIAYAALEDEDKAIEILEKLSSEDAKYNLELLEPNSAKAAIKSQED